MDKQRTFQLDDTTIDLNKVVAFEDVFQPTDAPTEGVSIVVYMANGSNTTIHGESNSEAFARAMDALLGISPV